jgi:hypothetical protein
MAITDTLTDIWHNVEDKAWSLADFMEDKGIPIASFCEDKGISPLFIFLGILVAIIILLAVFGGAGGPAGNAVVTVTVVDSAGNPVQANVKIVYNDGLQKSDNTDVNGKAVFEGMPFTSASVELADSRYTGKKTININKDKLAVELQATVLEGTLQVVVSDDSGSPVSAGSIEVKEFISGNIVSTEAVDGASSYSFEVPVGTYRVVVKSASGAELESETVEVSSGEPKSVGFTISEDAAESASVKIIVKDEKGTAIPDAYVVLHNARNDYSIGQQQTDANGETVFGELAVGTQVYPVVYKSNDRRYGQVSQYDGRNNYKKTMQSSMEIINVVLPLNGRV